MSLKYIRETYGVSAYRGTRIKCRCWDGWCIGSVTSAYGAYVVVRPDPWPNARLRFHPEDQKLIYMEQDNEDKLK